MSYVLLDSNLMPYFRKVIVYVSVNDRTQYVRGIDLRLAVILPVNDNNSPFFRIVIINSVTIHTSSANPILTCLFLNADATSINSHLFVTPTN